jgi:hypothetical protein
MKTFNKINFRLEWLKLCSGSVHLLRLLFASILFIWAGQCPAQEISGKELQFFRLQKRDADLSAGIDSLQELLQGQVRLIDQKKSSKNSSENAISGLMATALSTTQAIEIWQELRGAVRDSIGNIRIDLYRWYTREIESLQSRITKAPSARSGAETEKQIQTLVEKRMLVSPIAKRFSFDPGKILNIRVSAAADSFERAVYQNYLQQASGEVDSFLLVIKAKQSELQNMARLEDKADAFLDEVSESRIMTYNTKSASSAPVEMRDGEIAAGLDKDFFANNSIQYNSQINEFYLVLHQLRSSGMDVSSTLAADSLLEMKPMSYSELIKRLRNLEEYLKLYRRSLTERMK